MSWDWSAHRAYELKREFWDPAKHLRDPFGRFAVMREGDRNAQTDTDRRSRSAWLHTGRFEPMLERNDESGGRGEPPHRAPWIGSENGSTFYGGVGGSYQGFSPPHSPYDTQFIDRREERNAHRTMARYIQSPEFAQKHDREIRATFAEEAIGASIEDDDEYDDFQSGLSHGDRQGIDPDVAYAHWDPDAMDYGAEEMAQNHRAALYAALPNNRGRGLVLNYADGPELDALLETLGDWNDPVKQGSFIRLWIARQMDPPGNG